MKRFVGRLGVDVVSCHDAKPRRRRQRPVSYQDESDMEADRKAFRLCINAEHEDRLLVPHSWPDSIVISDWYFTQRKTTGVTAEMKRRRINGDNQSGSQSDAAHDSDNTHDVRLTSPKVITADTAGMDISTSEGCVADKTVIYIPSQDDPNQDGIQQTA
jgi:hypothetical protein